MAPRPVVGALEDGWLHGRGSVDMKGAVVAALHALAAVARAGGAAADVVLWPWPPRRTAGWARSPSCSATPPTTRASSRSRPAWTSSARRPAR